MVSPNLIAKKRDELTINDSTKKLFQVVYGQQSQDNKDADENIPKIKVSSLISKMAFYYEKIRNSVEYKEEYLMRKKAIERILKRKIVIESIVKVSKAEEIAHNLVVELIRAGYITNNSFPEYKVKEIAVLVEKYIKLKNSSVEKVNDLVFKNDVVKMKDKIEERNETINWLMSLLASEIEENLGYDKINKIVVSNMYEILQKEIQLPPDLPYKNDLNIQIYLSIFRNFFKFDQDMLSFLLFKYYNSEWIKNPDDEYIQDIAKNLTSLRLVVAKQLKHPLVRQLDKITKKYAVYFTVLVEVIEDNPVAVYDKAKNNEASFTLLIKKATASRYKLIKTKLWRAAFRSIIYIFITKSVFAVLIEIPAVKFLGEELNMFSLAINVSFPAILLFLIVLFTKFPVNKNNAKIVEGIREVVYAEHKRKDPFVLKKPKDRGTFTHAFFGIFYLAGFFISFYFIIWALDKLEFSWVSIIIFLFFLTFVSFFSIRVRRGVREFIIVESKENVFTFFADFFYMPIVALGKWMSDKASKMNVFVFILDFIIEAPFKLFIDIAEEWTKYIKERKDEIT